VSEAKEFRKPYYLEAYDRSGLAHVSVVLKCYRGTSTNPRWRNDDAGVFRTRVVNPAHADAMLDMYSTLCYIEADTSQICRTLKPRRSSGAGRPYYSIHYDVIVLFGLTELKAQIAWQEQVRSPIHLQVLRLTLISYLAKGQEKRCVLLFWGVMKCELMLQLSRSSATIVYDEISD
jgi:hypothetical protein